MYNGTVSTENSMAVPQKIKIQLLHDSEILLLDIYLKELKVSSLGDIYTPVFIAVLFIIAKR